MAAQQGFIYEKNATDFLKKFDLSDGKTAGASHTRPDLMLTVGGKEAGCELKISPTAGGSLVLKAYANKKPQWQFGNIEHDETEKMFLVDLAKESGVLGEINKEWKVLPFLTNDRTPANEKAMLKIPLRDRYKHDLAACRDIKMPLPAKAMSDYYNTKDTHYINVGTHGFYLLGDSDPLGLNEKLKRGGRKLIPKFEDVAKITARIRCQSKGVTKAEAQEKSKGTIGAQGYQFTFTMEFSLAKNTSPYNIAPLAANGKSVVILTTGDHTCLL